MSEFFLELFSEEIPADLQRNSRNVLLQNFQNNLIIMDGIQIQVTEQKNT